MIPQPVNPRIAIYGMGQYGSLITKIAVEKGWPIVAAYNRAGPKVGQDVGRVAGLGRGIGVTVQDCDTGNYDNLDANIGIVTHRDTLKLNFQAYQRFIEAGLNIGCHGIQSYHPFGNDPETAQEIDTLARKHGVTFTGSGIWDMSRIWSGILTAGPCTEISSIHISSLTDPHGQANSLEQIKQFAISEPIATFYEKGIDKSPLAHAYKTVPEIVLMALGYTVIESVASVEPVVYEEPVKTWYVPEGYFDAGLCMGVSIKTRTTTREGVIGTAQVDSRMPRPGEFENMAWEVEGKPRTRTMIERLDSAHATAANLFNRVPDILAAPPGIHLVSEMGPLRSSATR